MRVTVRAHAMQRRGRTGSGRGAGGRQVVAVGSGREDEDGKIVKPNVEPGAKVLYSRYSGTEFAGPDDTAYVVVRESDILATVA